jgi:hypothetical protein
VNLSGTIPMLRSVAHLGCNVFVSTSHSYLAIDCVVPTVGIWLSPTGVSAADLSVVISTCPIRADAGRPPDTVITTCDYLNSQLDLSHLVTHQSLNAGQTMRPEYDNWAYAFGYQERSICDIPKPFCLAYFGIAPSCCWSDWSFLGPVAVHRGWRLRAVLFILCVLCVATCPNESLEYEASLPSVQRLSGLVAAGGLPPSLLRARASG